jgi:hypothetical protein
MTDLPPRPPPRTNGRRASDSRYSQASMWLVLLVLAAVVVAAIAFSMNQRESGIDPNATAPLVTEPATTTTTEPSVSGAAPLETAPPAPDAGTAADPTSPAPDTGTVQP